jgi:hypothetical protein
VKACGKQAFNGLQGTAIVEESTLEVMVRLTTKRFIWHNYGTSEYNILLVLGYLKTVAQFCVILYIIAKKN